MDAKVQALTGAYNRNGKDLRIVLPNGADSLLALYSRQCIGGTRIVSGPNFPTQREASYVTFLHYTISVEGEIPATNAATTVKSWSETITRSGGGMRVGHIETLTGPPVKQLLKRMTTYRVVQSGNAIGAYDYPVPPRPIWPYAMVEAAQVTKQSPRNHSGMFEDFPVSWQYTFESSTPLLGGPTIR
jgi:hypothetical protein